MGCIANQKHDLLHHNNCEPGFTPTHTYTQPPIGPPSLEILRDLEIDATIFLPLGTKLLKQETMAGIDRSNPGVALDQVFQAWIKEGDDTLTWEKLAIALDDIEGQKDMATEVRGLYQCCYDC